MKINTKITSYTWEKEDLKDFRIWLIKNDMTLQDFCKKFNFNFSMFSSAIHGYRPMGLKLKHRIEEAGYKTKKPHF